jgi:hypothetical protein
MWVLWEALHAGKVMQKGLSKIPETVNHVQVLRPSFRKCWIAIGVCVTLIAVIIFVFAVSAFSDWMPRSNPVFAGIGVAGLFLVTAICLAHMIRSELRLDQMGFRVTAIFGRTQFLWRDVSGQFMVIATNRQLMVGYTLNSQSGASKGGPSRNSRKTLGLPDTYGLEARELADLMNDRLMAYRQKTGMEVRSGLPATVD